MNAGRTKLTKAACLGAASVLALSLEIVPEANAQQVLPPASVDAPAPRVVRRAPAKQTAPRARTAVRRAAPVAAPAQTATDAATNGRGGAERANGPVVGFVANQSATATKTDSPILTTPQSISVVTKDQIAQQQAQSMNEALRYTPGVITELYGGSSTTNDIKVRGFLAPRYLDGLRLPVDPILTFAQAKIEPWWMERIEVLKGPSSGLYGETSPGGLINMVSKRPTPYVQNEVQATTGSFGRAQAAFDFSGPIDKNKEFLYRFVGLARDADTVIDYNHEQRLFFAPSLTWQPTKDTSFTVQASVQRDRLKGQPQQYVPAVGTLFPSPLGRIPYSRYLGEPGFDRTNADQATAGWLFEHRFNSMLQFRQNARFANVTSDVLSLRNETGDPTLTGGVILRSGNEVHARSRSFTIDNQLQADFNTGSLTHKVLLGTDYVTSRSAAYYSASGFIHPIFGPIGTFYPLNVYAPVYGAQPNQNSFTPFFNRKSDQAQLGVYLQDEVKLDRFTLTLTGRHDNWQADTLDLLASTTTKQSEKAWTGRAGLSYLFDNGLAPYISYSTSFEPVTGISRSGLAGVFKPTTGEGGEVGFKFKPLGYNALLTAALFDVRQQNVLTADPVDPNFSVQTGEVRVRGVEADLKASLSNEIDITAGFTHLDPEVTKSNTGNVGKDVVNIPRNYASMWAFYTFRNGPLGGFGIGGGARYIGASFGDAQNTLVIPAYTLFDASMSYDFAYLSPQWKGFKLQVNATNLFDKYYVSTCFTGLAYCALGSSRTVLATLKYSWN